MTSTFHVGPYEIFFVETCRFGLDGGAMFGVVPKNLWQRAYADGDDKNRIPMAAKVMVIRGEGRVILVDTGNSPFMPPKQLEIYGIDFSQFSIDGGLAEWGIQPEDVTDVILTHLHFDHVGGAVVVKDNERFPRFPNAWYHVQKEHFDWAVQPSEKDRASFLPDMFLPLVDAGRLSFTEGHSEVFPMISVDRLYGHTSAMQSVTISDGITTVYHAADLFPTSAHVGTAWGMAYDNFPLTTLDEKKRILPRIIEEEWIVVFEHDAFRDAGKIVMGQKGPEVRDPFVGI